MIKTPIYTIGYGARTIEEFVLLLNEMGIEYLIDVRSRPYSRYKPEFSKDALEAYLRAHGLRYVFMGDTLGGQPMDPDCKDDEGRVLYEKVKEKPFYKEGIGRLQQVWEQQLTVALMCSEGKPENCHRSKLIGATLTDLKIDVAHIDEEGQLLTQEEVLLRSSGGQLDFGSAFRRQASRKRYSQDSEE